MRAVNPYPSTTFFLLILTKNLLLESAESDFFSIIIFETSNDP